LSQDIEQELLSWLGEARGIAVVGIGNPLRKDDSVGDYVAKRLSESLHSDSVRIFECETTPENYLGDIEKAKSSHVIIVDAAEIGLPPGTCILSEISDVRGLAVSSHNIPLSFFGEYLKKTIGAKVVLLAIQPEKVEFGEGLTTRVREAADEVTKILLKVLS
jgi:hydrogenase 3 maturation protease